MRIGLLSIIALALSISANSNSQTAAPAAPAAPPTLPAGPMPANMLPRPQVPMQPGAQPVEPGLQNGKLTQPGVVATNAAAPAGSFTNQTSAALQDQAFTVADRALLLQIRQTVQMQLQGASPSMPLHFNVRDGVVTLAGTVQNAAMEEQLESLVQQIPGVTGIVDQMTVGGTLSSRVPQQAMTAGDQTLLLRIRQTVVPQIQVASIPVPVDFNVQQGVVTVVGTLPNVQQKQQIMALVRQVPGVVQVNDQVTVNGTPAAFVNRNLPVVGPSSLEATTPGTPIGTVAPNNAGTTTPAASGTPNTVLTPTGRANTGPGLQDREQSPPGFSNTTNAVPRLKQ